MSRSYYKLRIIITFCVLTIFLVVIMSQLSYVFVRNIYLEQIREHAISSVKIISKQVESSYLDMLEFGVPTETMKNYFSRLLNSNLSDDATNSAFIFDSNFKVYAHSNTNIKMGRVDNHLLLFRNEVAKINSGEVNATLPFKGDDGHWYLLSFIKMTDTFYLAVRESAQRLKKVEDFEKIFWLIGIGGTVLAVLTGWFLSRSITQPLDKLVSYSHQIGKGDFNRAVPKKLKGEIKLLAEAMQGMRDDLSNNQKEKENMLAQIAHEIRNPLGGIELLTNLIKEDLAKGKVREEYLDKILSEINGLKSLISSFLNYSRPTPSSFSFTSIPEVVSEVKNIFQNELNKKNVKLNLNLEKTEIWFDSSHLRQVIMNLLSNSVEAVNMNGEITIHSFSRGKNNYISIADNGPGIIEENLNRIFNPFYTTKKDGTGLGLAICKKLCTENNSQLLVESKIGEGTKFTILKELAYEQ